MTSLSSLYRNFQSAGKQLAVTLGVSLLAVCGTAPVLAQTYSNVLSFSGTAAPNYGTNSFQLSLVQAPDGFFYGTTRAGGTSSKGVVYKVSAGGAYTLLHTFTATTASTTDGATPYGSLCLGADGNLYGTTSLGGANNYGTFYQIKTDGTFTLLHSFAAAEGANPFAGVTEGTDGNFYGTLAGQASSYGSIYKVTPTGTVTVLHAFGGGNDGAASRGSLLQGADGNFYGTTNSGGASSAGLIYKITPAGTYTVLYNFTNLADGGTPQGQLVQASDGNFYGTSNGGTASYGYFYRLTPSGTFTALHTFTAAEGYGLYQGYLLATDGNLYTTATTGGANNFGAIQKMTLAGVNTDVYDFKGTTTDGAAPRAVPLQGADGSLYGTTFATTSLSSGNGVVFRFQPSTAVLPAEITYTVPSTIYAGSTFNLGYAVYNAYSQTFQRCLATNNAGDTTGWVGIKTGAPTTTTAALTAPTTPGIYTYTLTCGGVESGFASVVVTQPPPVVTSISPKSSPAAGGVTTVIRGTGFLGATQVNFGTMPSPAFNADSDTQIRANAPAGTNGTTVDVTVTGPNGTSAISAADKFTYQPQPTAQTITFTQPTPNVFTGTTATLSATSTSGLPVTFSITQGPAFAMLSGTNNSMISYIAQGTVVIAADQAGNSIYAAAPQVTQTVNVTNQSVFIVNSSSVTSRYDNGTGQSAAASGGGIGIAVTNIGTVDSIGDGGSSFYRFSNTGGFLGVNNPAPLTGGRALAIDGNINTYIANADGTVAYVRGNTGVAVYPIGIAAAGNINNPTGIAVDPSGSIWISNSGNNTVTEIIGGPYPVATPLVVRVISRTPASKP